jgi:hypothetical protein
MLLFVYKLLNSESPASIHTLSLISSLQVWWCKAHPKKFAPLCELARTGRQIGLEHIYNTTTKRGILKGSQARLH